MSIVTQKKKKKQRHIEKTTRKNVYLNEVFKQEQSILVLNSSKNMFAYWRSALTYFFFARLLRLILPVATYICWRYEHHLHLYTVPYRLRKSGL